jgi:hypothetical protein
MHATAVIKALQWLLLLLQATLHVVITLAECRQHW